MTTFDYDRPQVALTQILEWVEHRIDLAHVAAVEQRHLDALRWLPVDRLPTTVSAPIGEPFQAYPYEEAFSDPTKMLVNELVGPGARWGQPSPSIVNSVIIQDDFPLQVRANYGIGIIASLFGAKIRVSHDAMPWVAPIGPQALQQCARHGLPEMKGGLLQQTLDTMAFFREALAPYPRCREAIRITQPDLQGPFDIAAQLWGGDIFTAFYDCPDFLRGLLELLADTYIQVCQVCTAESTAAIFGDFAYLHFTICRGNCLLKDDSSIMLSPAAYAEFIRPANERVLTGLGGGGIHWCGSGDHWRAECIATEGLMGIDWGNPVQLDMAAWAATLQRRKLPVVDMDWSDTDLRSAGVPTLFPTGASVTVSLDRLAEAGNNLHCNRLSD